MEAFVGIVGGIQIEEFHFYFQDLDSCRDSHLVSLPDLSKKAEADHDTKDSRPLWIEEV